MINLFKTSIDFYQSPINSLEKNNPVISSQYDISYLNIEKLKIDNLISPFNNKKEKNRNLTALSHYLKKALSTNLSSKSEIVEYNSPCARKSFPIKTRLSAINKDTRKNHPESIKKNMQKNILKKQISSPIILLRNSNINSQNLKMSESKSFKNKIGPKNSIKFDEKNHNPLRKVFYTLTSINTSKETKCEILLDSEITTKNIPKWKDAVLPNILQNNHSIENSNTYRFKEGAVFSDLYLAGSNSKKTKNNFSSEKRNGQLQTKIKLLEHIQKDYSNSKPIKPKNSERQRRRPLLTHDQKITSLNENPLLKSPDSKHAFDLIIKNDTYITKHLKNKEKSYDDRFEKKLTIKSLNSNVNKSESQREIDIYSNDRSSYDKITSLIKNWEKNEYV